MSCRKDWESSITKYRQDFSESLISSFEREKPFSWLPERLLGDLKTVLEGVLAMHLNPQSWLLSFQDPFQSRVDEEQGGFQGQTS